MAVGGLSAMTTQCTPDTPASDAGSGKGVQIPEHVRNLTPYKSGKNISELAREKGLARIVKLASNENPLGCSSLALEAIKQSLDGAYRYVDPGAFELTTALSEYHNRPRKEIICGAGTDSLLSYIICTFSEEGDEILTAESTFIGMFVNVKKYNRRIVTAPMDNYAFNLQTLSAGITARTKIIYLANPNNPTGTMIPKSELDKFIKSVPQHILIILDEAYFNYAREYAEHPDGMTYQQDNVIVTRTFSKDYGLAGLRVGYAVGPERLIHELYKIKLPFEPSYTAQSAAVAALGDKEFLARTLQLNRDSMKQLSNGLDSLGLKYINSYTNFLLLILDDETQAAEFALECLSRGLILRHTKLFGAPRGVRINTGTKKECAFALEVIEEVWSHLRRA
jgi:histidinol-phosphate aminotransferase